MDFKEFQEKVFPIIKFISTGLIASALGLELWNLQAFFTQGEIPSFLNPIFGIERLAVAIHLAEGAIASVYAPTRNQQPLQYGIYTFFVGTVGLLELLNQEDNS